MEEKEFILEKCEKCINRNADLCEIRRNIKGEYQCQYYKENVKNV